MLEIGVERLDQRLGVGVRLHYASSSLALEGSDAVTAIKDAITVYGLRPRSRCRCHGSARRDCSESSPAR